MAHIAIQNVSFSYPAETDAALRTVSLNVERGEFVVLCGASGSGKTTLLRLLKPSLAPVGTFSGEILLNGSSVEMLSKREEASRIGFVQQNPDAQLVTDKVWHELAFGLESLGTENEVIRRKTAEMAAFFGIEDWFYKDVSELSGGQKQTLNLAGVMTMQPEILLLDEPTSQLDPIASRDFLSSLSQVNRELGVTVIISEHRLEEVLDYADRMVVMDKGGILCDDTPANVGKLLREDKSAMFAAMPTPMRVWAAVSDAASVGVCPVNVREGRRWLENYAAAHPLHELPKTDTKPHTGKPSVCLKEIWFRYEKNTPDILRGLSLEAWAGEVTAILGGNGAGKTTTLLAAAGLQKPWRGRVEVLGQSPDTLRRSASGGLVMLPQNPASLFTHSTVREELETMLNGTENSVQKAEILQKTVRLCRLERLLNRHPYDLSGGEQQCAALACVLLRKPKVLLLDEPTKGLDAGFKERVAGILRKLAREGVTVLLISHDVAFCAENADRCALLFDGQIAAVGTPRDFFAGLSFYTTSANRMARQLEPQAVTVSDVVALCGGKLPELPPDDSENSGRPHETDKTSHMDKSDDTDGFHDESRGQGLQTEPKVQKKLFWKRLIRKIAAGGAVLSLILAVLFGDDGGVLAGKTLAAYGGLIISLAVLLGVGTDWKREGTAFRREKRQLSRKSRLLLAVSLLLMPLTIYVGIRFFGDRRYYFISLLLIIEAILPSFVLFEDKKPSAREIVLLAVICAVGVAGRTAFFMLPSFKPVLAIVIIAGVAFGGEMGFLVGATTALVSNFFFGQGPWTPWQMFAFGLCGMLAGVFHDRGFLSENRLALSVFGALEAFFLYGGIMNPASVLMFQNKPTVQMFLTAYLTGLPSDMVHACATVCFLWFFSKPFLEKLARVRVKYGLLVR